MADRLDDGLRDLATRIVFPPTPDLREGIFGRLHRPQPRWWRPAVQRALVLALIASVLLAATVAALVMALPGLRLTFVPSLPSPTVPLDPLATRLALGDEIAPDTLEAGIPMDLGRPDEAYDSGDGAVITLVYAADDDLPEMAAGIGLLVQVIDGAMDRPRVEKLVTEVGASVTVVDVAGATGFWISGPPHLVRYLGSDGIEGAAATRVAGDTLVWERDAVLYRIESGAGLAATMRIAESIK